MTFEELFDKFRGKIETLAVRLRKSAIAFPWGQLEDCVTAFEGIKFDKTIPKEIKNSLVQCCAIEEKRLCDVVTNLAAMLDAMFVIIDQHDNKTVIEYGTYLARIDWILVQYPL